MNFIKTYMPAAAELTRDELYSTRERLASYCLSVAPDVEVNPNSVVGDLIVSPQAFVITAIEKGLDRFMGDLDLANVANGNIWNCEFVAKWIENFAVNYSGQLRASGVVRLTFTESKQYVLDRSLRFISGGNIFSLYLPNLGPYVIYRPNDILPEATNGTVLIDTGSGTYFADVVVLGEVLEEEEEETQATSDADEEEEEEGTEEEEEEEEGTEPQDEFMTAGTSLELSTPIPELDSAVALAKFDKGTETISISDLAKRARTTMHSASLNTRNGAIQYVRSICPFIEGVYATHNGDREMLRDFDNPFASSMGCLDLYVRSKGYNYTEVQTLKLYLNDDETAFEGDFPYVGQPYHIESVTHTDVPEIPDLVHVITSTFSPLPSTGTQHPGAIAAYTTREKLYISIPDVTDEIGDSRFNPIIEEDGRRSTIFTITYQTDPMLPEISQTVENEDYRPVNTSILVRGFIPVIIDQFEVVYVRQPGVLPDLDTAFTRIKEYMGNLGAPDVYSEAEIAHIMHDCGVKYMKGINVKARVQWVVGEKLQDRTGEIVDSMQLEIRNSDGLRISYPAENITLRPTDMYVCSPRNIRYWYMEGSLTFKEVRDI